jgi:hypothetical protein
MLPLAYYEFETIAAEGDWFKINGIRNIEQFTKLVAKRRVRWISPPLNRGRRSINLGERYNMLNDGRFKNNRPIVLAVGDHKGCCHEFRLLWSHVSLFIEIR